MMLKRWSLIIAVIGGLCLPSMAFARPWRDQKGNVINAEFVKVERGMVYLKPENKYAAATPFPFYDFSEADQEFLKTILTKKGQADRIPPPPPKKDEPNGKPNQPGAANVGNVPIAIAAPPNSAPAIPRSDNFSFPMTTVNSAPQPAPNNNLPALPITVTPPTSSDPSQPNPSQPNFPPRQNPTPNFTPEQLGLLTNGKAMVKKCSGCNKEIPDSATAGQNCPRCGVYWNTEQNQFGTVTNTAPGGLYGGPTYSRGMVRLAFLIGAFVIGGIAKIVHDNK